MGRFFLISLTALMIGCAPAIKTQYVTSQVSRPERPVLPKIPSAKLRCLDQATYQRLYDRQRLITDYAVTLEAIIDSTIAKSAEK